VDIISQMATPSVNYLLTPT